MTAAFSAALSTDAAASAERFDEQPESKEVYREFRRFAVRKVLSRHRRVLRQRLAKVRHVSCASHELQPSGVQRKPLPKTVAGGQCKRTRKLH